MPAFKFNVRSRSVTLDDPESSELPDLTAALEEARLAARELWAAGIRAGEDRQDWFIDVTDEAGTLLEKVRFSETARRT